MKTPRWSLRRWLRAVAKVLQKRDGRPDWGLVLYAAGAVLVTAQWALAPREKNFLIFRAAFHHLVAGTDLYARNPNGDLDLFLYSPTFPLLFAPFAVPPVIVGLLLWNAANAVALYMALTALLPDRAARFAAAIVFVEVLRSLQSAQSNALVAALIVLALVALERKRPVLVALAVALGACIKVYPLGGLLLGVLDPRRLGRAVLAFLVGVGILVALPLLVTTPGALLTQWRSWGAVLFRAPTQRGMSVMGILYDWFGVAWPVWTVQLAGTAVLVLPLLMRPDRWSDPAFRRLFLASLLVYFVIFNHMAESASFVVALTGMAVWYVQHPPAPWRTTLLVLALALITGTSLDLVPGWVRSRWVFPYDLKALPCIMGWVAIQADLLRRTTD